MKTFLKLSTVWLILSLVPCFTQGLLAQKIALGLVLEDTNQVKLDRDHDTQAMNAATTAFLSTHRFNVIERKELAGIFEEKSLKDILGTRTTSTITDIDEDSGEGAPDAGLFDLTGLDMIGFVSYTVKRTETQSLLFTLNVRLALVSTGEVLGTYDSVRLSLVPSNSLAIAGDQLASTLRGAFPPEGIVVRVHDDGKQVVVDMGTNVGLQHGDTLVIIENAEAIIHPVTGEVLPGEERIVGKLRVASVHAQTSTCKVATKKLQVAVSQRVRYRPSSSGTDRWVPKSVTRMFRSGGAQ